MVVLNQILLPLSWCLAFAAASPVKSPADNLLSLFVVFRHGDDTLGMSYPNDPYNNISFWPGGFGQLTNAGKIRSYENGRWFRQRYDGFIPEKYSLYDVNVASTDIDRTLMSAACYLAGLYPPVEDEIWNPNLQWQPIPIHTAPQLDDPILGMGMGCPKYVLMYELLPKSEHFRNIDKQLADFYAYLSLHSGMALSRPDDGLTTRNRSASCSFIKYILIDLYQIGFYYLKQLIDILSIYAALVTDENFNYTLPDWAKSVYPEELTKWSGVFFSMLCFNKDMARLSMGPFLDEMIENFKNITNYGKNAYKKVQLFSGHDTTVANILMTLGLYDYTPPPYSASLIFELRDGKNESYVNILYKNGTDPVPLVLPGCQFDCDLDSFVKLLRPVTVNVTQWKEECFL